MIEILHPTLSLQSLTNTADEFQKKNLDPQPGRQKNLLISHHDPLLLEEGDHLHEEDETIDPARDHPVTEHLQPTNHLHLVTNPGLAHLNEKSTKHTAATHPVLLKESNLRNL